MNANRTLRQASAARITLALALAALAGCVSAPQRTPPLATRALPPPPPPPPAAPPLDWRDAPATPGEWRSPDDASAAIFAEGLFTIRCVSRGQVLRLERAGKSPGPAPMTISTTTSSRTLTAAPLADLPGVVAAPLQPRDPLLDAMAFSRGRIAVEVAGMAPLYIPAWPEMARVIEGCR